MCQQLAYFSVFSCLIKSSFGVHVPAGCPGRAHQGQQTLPSYQLLASCFAFLQDFWGRFRQGPQGLSLSLARSPPILVLQMADFAVVPGFPGAGR